MIIAVVVSGSLAVAAFAGLAVVAGACALVDDTVEEERAGERLREYLDGADTDRAGASSRTVIALLMAAALLLVCAIATELQRRTASKPSRSAANRSRKGISA